MRIAVIGSGIFGASVAYHATRRGADTLLVDHVIDGQATDAGAGIVCPWTSRLDQPEWYALAAAGARYYPEIVAALAEAGAPDTGYGRVGALRLAADEAELRTVHEAVLDRRRDAPEAGDVNVLSGPETRALFPPLRGAMAALHVTGAARVDGKRLRDALRQAAVRGGAMLRHGTARLHRAGTTCRVTVNGQAVDADAVVVAAGAWTAGLLAPVGVAITVAPQRGQIVHLGLDGTDTSRWPVVLPPGSHYLVAFDDSCVVAGATRETGSGFDYRVTAGGLAQVLQEALAVAPGLVDATHLETRVGFRPAAPDARPLLGPVPGIDGLVVATGLGATGLTIGPYAGKLAAAVATGTTPELDLTPYDPLRG